MNTVASFKASLQIAFPDNTYSPVLKSLWYDGKDNWDMAHAQVDKLTDKDSAWVHAYLHRKEGDIWNADYWYARANKTRPSCSFQEEWEQLVEFFLT